MIPRYARPEMVNIWEPETRFSIWLDIETHAMDAMADLELSQPKPPRLSGKRVHLTLTALTRSSAKLNTMSLLFSPASLSMSERKRALCIKA